MAKDIVGHLKRAGFKAFFVGGCVRDIAMNIPPKEYDITTSATPQDVMKIFPSTIPVGVSFGVVLVLEGNNKFEVASFRKEEKYTDGRHPDRVVYSTDEKDDVMRRDFTINGMLYEPFEEMVIDLVGGLDDIKKRIIKTIGKPDDRFKEDKLRMLRAIRFGAGLDFKIEEKTFLSIKSLARSISQVSKERIRDEIIKIITQNNPGKGLKLLRESKLLRYILPDVEKMNGVPQPPQFHPEGDVFNHTCMILDKLYEITGGAGSPELAMGALLHDVGKPDTYSVSDRIRFNGHDRIGARMAKNICKDLKFSNKQIEIITSLVKEHLKFKDVFKMREATIKRFLGMSNFDDHLKLHLADCLASHGSTEAYEFIVKKLKDYKKEELKPKPLLNGYDLIDMGYPRGPLYTKILDSLEEAQLEGIVKNKEDAKGFILKEFPLENFSRDSEEMEA
ncbi:MAG: CCA tRNA nucleotidyltransferase [Deltaproteobacteria bacterium]|nr:CCA tRNA nucleotidyltransferase [Deltaproteobacteria bacterium]